MQRFCRSAGRHRRRAVIVAQVAVCSTVILGMGALVIDIGAMYTTQTELQVAADAAALAAAGELAGHPQADPRQAAVGAASEFASRNHVRGTTPAVLSEDVEFGRAVLDTGTGKFQFTAGGTNYDSVRVTVRRLGGGAGGATRVQVPFLFGPIFGQSGTELEARAAAVLIPRDIAVVIDLSGSMNDDSELRHYKAYTGEEGQWRPGVEINLRDIWCALDGPEPQRPYLPGPEDETEYREPYDYGPAVGAMNVWGSEIVPDTYNPTTDAGLWYIPKGSTCTNAAALASLAARGYSADEINCLKSGAQDNSYSNQWRNRTAVILGLATWKSGRPGGKVGGDGDIRVEDNVANEFTWTAYPAYRANWTWADYLNYMSATNTAMYSANSNFRYRGGIKTFVNFLLENKSQKNQTNNLWQTPEQPLRAVKDAVQAMTDVIVSLESLDHMSLEIYALTARHEVNLSANLQAVPTRLYQMQSAHYDSTTNMGGGLLKGMAELSSVRARSAAAKVMVLMSDGKPNIDENGNYVAEGAPAVVAWIGELAQQAADEHVRIYTISVGGDSDAELMTEIATITGGQHFHAEGTPAEYEEQLNMIFRSLGGKRPVALIE